MNLGDGLHGTTSGLWQSIMIEMRPCCCLPLQELLHQRTAEQQAEAAAHSKTKQ
jgi:hypothetical protein